MRKLFLVLLFLGSPAFADESAYDRVMKTQTLRCGYLTSPPVLLKDANTGALSGMDYEIWERLGQRLDLKIEWVEASGWGSFAEDMQQGKFDAYCTQIWMNPPRAKYLSVTDAVLYQRLYAYVRPDETRFKAAADLDRESVIIPVIDGDITEYMAKSGFPNAQRHSLPGSSDWSELYMAVTTKKADVFFVDTNSFAAVAANNPVKLEKLDTPPVFVFGGRYSMDGAETRLRDAVNVMLQGMVDDGTVAAVAEKSVPGALVPARHYSENQ